MSLLPLALCWMAFGTPVGHPGPAATVVAGSPRLRQAVPFRIAGRNLHWKDGKLLLSFTEEVHGGDPTTGVDWGESNASVHTALLEAARAWTAAGRAAIAIDAELTAEQQAGAGGRSIVTFTDPAPFDAGLCDKRYAAACTLLTFTVETGEIQTATIAFNPYLRFSSIGLPGTYDIGAVMLHEVGHALGLDHSALFHTAMNPFVEAGVAPGSAPVYASREPAPDDLLTLEETYPGPATQTDLGKVEGVVRAADRTPVVGGHVVAVGAGGTPVRGTLTDTEGRYGMLVPPGDYTLVLEPLDGPVTPARFTEPPDNASPAFPTVFWTSAGGDSLNRETVSVPAGAAVTGIDFSLPAGEVSDVKRAAVVEPITTRYVYQLSLARGRDYFFRLNRQPVEGTPAVRFSGASIALRDSAAVVTDTPSLPGLVEQAISIPADAATGVFNVYYHNGTSGAMLAGAVQVSLNPSVAAVRLAETGEELEVYGAGQEISIAGADLAPREACAAPLPEGWPEPTQLAGTEVRIGGRLAPLLSVSPKEIRARIPADAGGEAVDLAVLTAAGVESPPVRIAVHSGTAPATFAPLPGRKLPR